MTTDLSADTPKKPDRETDDRIRELFHESRGRNEIARMCGVTTYRVDQVCKAYGLTFDAERTRKATEVHIASAGEQRRKLAGRFRNLADVALNGAENTTDPDEMFKFTRVAAVATDKDSVLDEMIRKAQSSDDQDRAAEAFIAFGNMIRDSATQASERNGTDLDRPAPEEPP